jgi:D-ribose pyranose/furanose isomerase RbsD
VIVRPKGSEAVRVRALRHDLSVAGNAAGEEDRVVVCDRGVKRLDHTGAIDMAFIREVYTTLAMPQEDGHEARLF